MTPAEDAKQTQDTKNSETTRDAQRTQASEQPGLYWAVAPQQRRVRR